MPAKCVSTEVTYDAVRSGLENTYLGAEGQPSACLDSQLLEWGLNSEFKGILDRTVSI